MKSPVSAARDWMNSKACAGKGARFDLALWSYPPEAEAAKDEPSARVPNEPDGSSHPRAGPRDQCRETATTAGDRALAARGFFPTTTATSAKSDPGAVQLTRQESASVDTLLPEVESGFARINAQLRGLHRTLRTRMAELEAADRHIARLEEKVLKLKQAKRDLKQLKAEKQALRKSLRAQDWPGDSCALPITAKTGPGTTQAVWPSAPLETNATLTPNEYQRMAPAAFSFRRGTGSGPGSVSRLSLSPVD